MKTQLGISQNTTFQQVYETFSEHKGSLIRKADDYSIRFSGNSLHTKSGKPSGIGTTAASRRAEKKEEAVKKIKESIESQFKLAGLGGGNRAGQIFKIAGIEEGAKRIKIGDLKELKSVVDREILKGKIEQFKQSGLDGMAGEGVKWEISKNGGNGVIFAKQTEGLEKVVILKFEGKDQMETNIEFYKVIDHLRSKVSLPFDVPNFTFIEVAEEGEDRPNIENKFVEIYSTAKRQLEEGGGNNINETEKTRLQRLIHKTNPEKKDEVVNYHSSLKAAGGMGKFEFLSKAKTFDSLTVNERFDLLKSGDFAKDLGETMVMSTLLGLKDHVCAPGMGATNFTNLMVSDDGRLQLIDIDIKKIEGEMSIGHTPQKIKETFTEILNFLAGVAQNPASIQQICNDKGRGTPLEDFFWCLFSSYNLEAGVLFNNQEMVDGKPIQQVIQGAPVNRFVANVMIGMLEGFDSLANDSGEFCEAFGESGSYAQDIYLVFEGIRDRLDEMELMKAISRLNSYALKQRV